MTSIRAGRVQVGAHRVSRTAPAARAVLTEAFNHALPEAVRFRTPDGEFVVGPATDGSECAYVLDVLTTDFFTDVVCFGNLGMGEAYMRGDFVMASGRLEDFLTLLLRSRLDEKVGRTSRLRRRDGPVRGLSRPDHDLHVRLRPLA
jgi:hypothetical protein